jgi:glycolate oxidase iron-sulfur subunit
VNLSPNPDLLPLEEADRCVQCGLCLPVCATYRLAQTESESPRGRIALMRALGRGALPASASLVAHLDSCLGCLACERLCPANVKFGKLLDGARVVLPPRPRNVLLTLVTRQPRLATRLAMLARTLGLGRLLAGPAGAALRTPAPVARAVPTASSTKGAAQLFTGCTGNIAERDTLAAAHAVLAALGYEVRVPDGQGCCGALDWHAGRRTEALAHMQTNLATFDASQPVIGIASGCGAFLAEYREHAGTAIPFHDILMFLDRADWSGVALAPVEKKIAVHMSCSLRNALRGEKALMNLLARLPGATVIELPESAICCGGAGDAALTHAGTGRALAARKAALIIESGAEVVVTANIGCRLAMQAALREAGSRIEVVHPVSLVASALM